MDQEELRDYVQARLKVFYEEELDVPLVLFNEVLDHVLRIDRIFKQNQVGVAYAGVGPLFQNVLCNVILVGSPLAYWCQWSWKDHPLSFCCLDQWPVCLPDQGLLLVM